MSAPSVTIHHLQQRLRPMARRLRLRDTLWFASSTLWIAALASLALQIAGRLFPIPGLLWISLAPLALWALIVAGYLAVRPLPPICVAQRLDTLLDARERLATALELGQRTERTPLVELQQRDAYAFATTLRPRLVPLKINRRPLIVALALVAAMVALIIAPNPQDQILAERAAIREATQQAAAQIEQLRQEIAQNQSLSPEERAALDRELAEVQQRLEQNPGNREEALADLSTAEARLQQRLTPDADAQRAALEQLARNLQAMEKQPQSGRPTLEQAEDALRQLAQQIESMTAAERRQLAEQLRQEAQQLQQSAPQTAQALQQAADALQQNDVQQAQQALEQAAQSVQQAQQQQAAQQAAQQAIAQLQEERQSIAQSGQHQQGQQQGSQQQPGQQLGQQQQQQGQQQQQQGQQPGQQQQGQQQGSQQQPGQQLGRQQGQQQPGQQQQGQQLGQQQGQEGQAGSQMEGNQQSPATGNQAGTGSSDLVYQPFTPDGQPRDIERIQGQEGAGGQTQIQQGQLNAPGSVSPLQTPYQQVLREYQRAAGEALDRSAIPPHLKDYVRDYFSRLEP
ncbi:MAG: hypothetical protein RMJ48_00195 [Roseiflexaceae bacterium]|nr:hypothetical protein [Roseiflexaceae bacterium]